MATLIDRDKCQERIFRFAKRLADWGFPKEAEAVRAVAKGIKLEKTVDAVEVVQCKDCKHGIWDEYEELWKCVEAAEYEEEYGVWGGFVSYNKAEHYCAYGERRTDG